MSYYVINGVVYFNREEANEEQKSYVEEHKN